MALTTVTETKTITVTETKTSKTTTVTNTKVTETEKVGENNNVVMETKPAVNISVQNIYVDNKFVLGDNKIWPCLSNSSNESVTKLSCPDSNNIDSTKELDSSNNVDSTKELDSSNNVSELEPSATGTNVSSAPPILPLDEQPTSNDSTKDDGEDDKESSHQSSPVEESKSDQNHDSSKPNSSHSVKNNNRVHPNHQNSVRKPHYRGESSHQYNWGRRNGQGRGYNDWNNQMGFARPPYFYPPYVPYPVMHPIMTPMMPPVYLAPGMQQYAPPPRPYYPEDRELSFKIRKQIEFYFSTENLIKDTFLRKQMDRYGWVNVDVISEFNLVKHLCRNTTNAKYQILRALRQSTVVQVQGIKIRRRDDWQRWVLPVSFENPTPLVAQIAQAPAPVQDHTEVISEDGSATASTSHASPNNSNNASMASVEAASPTEYNNA